MTVGTTLSEAAVRMGLYVLVLGPPVAYYVYRDRIDRDAPRPRAWAVGAGLFGVAGLVVYLAVRDRGG